MTTKGILAGCCASVRVKRAFKLKPVDLTKWKFKEARSSSVATEEQSAFDDDVASVDVAHSLGKDVSDLGSQTLEEASMSLNEDVLSQFVDWGEIYPVVYSTGIRGTNEELIQRVSRVCAIRCVCHSLVFFF